MADSVDLKLLQEYYELYQKVNGEALKEVDASKLNAKVLQENVDTLRRKYKELEDQKAKARAEEKEDYRNIAKELSSQFVNTKKVTDSQREQTRLLNSLQSSFSTLRQDYKGLTQLNSEQLKTQQKDLGLQRNKLDALIEQHTQSLQNNNLSEEERAGLEKDLTSLTNTSKVLEGMTTHVRDRLKEQEKLEEKLEEEKRIYKDIEKSFLKISGNSKIGEAVAKRYESLMNKGMPKDEAKKSANQFGAGAVVGNQLRSTAKSQFGIEIPTNKVEAIIELVKLLHARFKEVDKAVGGIATSLNTSYQEAFQVTREFAQLANSSQTLGVNTKQLTASLQGMNTDLGTAIRFDNQRLIQQTKLRELAKFTNEELADTNRASLINNKTQDELVESRLGQIRLTRILTGAAIDERRVLNDIAKASNTIKINFIGRDQDLAKAAATARTLGMELSKVDATADSLLDFDNSIQKQMEAELLTGQTLNLERARDYALKNDIGGLTQELNKQGMDAVKFGNLNRLAQKSYAEALGMTREGMSEVLMQQEVLSKLHVADLDVAKKQYMQAVAQGKGQEFLNTLGSEALATQFQQSTMQDRMAMATERLLSAFDQLSLALAPVFDVFLSIFKIVGATVDLVQSLIKMLNVFQLFKDPQAYFKNITDIGSGLFNFGKNVVNDVITPTGAGASTNSDKDGYNTGLMYDSGTTTKSPSMSIPKQDQGGVIKKSGIVQADAGEVFTGTNTIGIFKGMYQEMQNQNKALQEQNTYLAALVGKNTTLVLNDQVLATAVARNASTVPGNLLNPGSSTYS